MNVLALDTSTERISVAIKRGEDVYGVCFLGKRKHVEVLPKLIEVVLERADLRADELNVVGVGIGPGSLTGLRVGIATAVGLVAPFDTPVVTLVSFEMAAKSLPTDGVIVVSRKAREGFRYFAAYEKRGNELSVVKPPCVDSVHVYGDFLEKVRPSAILEDEYTISPFVLVEETEKAFNEGKAIHYFQIEPLYLQKSIAEMNLEKKKGG